MPNTNTVIAPVPGIFYRRPSPSEPVYMTEGDTVQEGDVIGLIEVMKNFYEVTATQSGVLRKFHVDDEHVVDAGAEVATIESD